MARARWAVRRLHCTRCDAHISYALDVSEARFADLQQGWIFARCWERAGEAERRGDCRLGWAMLGILVALMLAFGAGAASAQSAEQVLLLSGARAPFTGHLVLPEAYQRMARQLAGADVIVPRLELELERAQSDRDTAFSLTADRLEASASRLDGTTERLNAAVDGLLDVQQSAPTSASAPLWAGAAGLAALVVGGLVYAALEPVGGRLQDLGGFGGALLGSGGVVGLAVTLE